MKKSVKLLSFGLLVLSIQSCVVSQTFGPDPIVDVVQLEGKSKDEVFVRANTWMVETFNDAESVIQYTDKEAGIVTGKYSLFSYAVSQYSTASAMAVIKIKVKDGATQISIKPIPFEVNTMYNMENMEKKVMSEVANLIHSFQVNMQKSEDFNF